MYNFKSFQDARTHLLRKFLLQFDQAEVVRELRLDLLELRATTHRHTARHVMFFTAVRLLSVYFGLASRPVLAVRDCVTLESFFDLPLPPSHA